MEIKELIIARAKLEVDIREDIAGRMRYFEQTTGVSISSVQIEFIDLTAYGNPKSTYVTNVTVKLELE